MELINEFSWSNTKHDNFQTCKRKYYFDSYGSWGGWSKGADKRTKQIYTLKQLRNQYLYIGNFVHTQIESILSGIKNGTIIDFQTIKGIVERRITNDIIDSKKQKYWIDPKKYCGFLEDEYSDGISEETYQQIIEKTLKQLENFYKSKYYKLSLEFDSGSWLPIEEFSSFNLNNNKITTKIDFAYKIPPDKLMIVDWKTGKPDPKKNMLQLSCYALYSVEKWGFSPINISTCYFFLTNNSETIHSISEPEIETVRLNIINSIRQMKNMLRDEKNNVAFEDDFPLTNERWNCNYCNYQILCNRNSKGNLKTPTEKIEEEE